VLEHPEIPLHTNASENDLRTFVTKRKISGGTMSLNGRMARDTMLGLLKACRKLRLSFYHFLGDRLEIAGKTIARWPPWFWHAAEAKLLSHSLHWYLLCG